MLLTLRREAPPSLLGVSIPGTPDRTEDLPELLTAAEAGRGQESERPAVVVAVRAAPGGGPVALGRKLRSLAYTCDVAVIGLELPVTAATVVFRAAQSMVEQPDSDLLPLLLERLAHQVRTAAVLDTVAKLSDPAPSLAQHIRSWFPRSCFVVSPSRTVASGTAARLAWQTAMMDAAGAPGTPLVCDHGGPAEYADLLPAGVQALEAGQQRPVETWGARRWLEVSWLPAEPERILERLAGDVWGACRNCGRRIVDSDCRYCAVVNPIAAAPARRDGS